MSVSSGPWYDGLSVVEDLCGTPVIEGCRVPTVKPGPCPGYKRGTSTGRKPRGTRTKTGTTPKGTTPKAEKDTTTLQGRIENIGIKSSEKLSGGRTAQVDLVTLNDGSKVVRKRITGDEWRDRKTTQDAEELSAKLGRSMKVNVPQVYRESDDTIFMDFVDGKVGLQLPEDDKYLGKGVVDIFGPDQVHRAGLFDIISGNTDRSSGNWMLKGDDELWAIDHGFGFIYGSDPQENLTRVADTTFSWFVRGTPKPGEALGDSDRYTPADVDYLEKSLTELKPEFDRLDRTDWYDVALERTRGLKPYAKGKVNLY